MGKQPLDLTGAIRVAKRAVAEPVDVPDDPSGAPLNFRVSHEFRRAFRRAAVDHELRQSELLRRCFEAWEREQGRGG